MCQHQVAVVFRTGLCPDTCSYLSSVCLQAFDVVERSFLESIDDALAEKASLQSQLPEVT